MVQASYAASQTPVEGLPTEQASTADKAITGQSVNRTKQSIDCRQIASRTALYDTPSLLQKS